MFFFQKSIPRNRARVWKQISSSNIYLKLWFVLCFHFQLVTMTEKWFWMEHLAMIVKIKERCLLQSKSQNSAKKWKSFQAHQVSWFILSGHFIFQFYCITLSSSFAQILLFGLCGFNQLLFNLIAIESIIFNCIVFVLAVPSNEFLESF